MQVPWLLQLPDAVGAAVRSQALVEPADLWATLLDWWGVADVPRSPTAASVLPLVRQRTAPMRSAIGSAWPAAAAERAIRTPAWYLRGGLDPELYAKPDDRWEVNNVASRCQEVVESLQDALTRVRVGPCRRPDFRASAAWRSAANRIRIIRHAAAVGRLPAYRPPTSAPHRVPAVCRNATDSVT